MSLPRYPKYKESGVEWLGEVPEHWEILKLRSIARLESGHTPSRQRPDWWIEPDCVIPWFTLADVSFLRDPRNCLIRETSQRISELGMANSAARLLPAGTVILSRTASVGFSGIAGIDLAVSQDFAAWVCGPRVQPWHLLFCLRAMQGEFRRLMMGSTHQTIYMPDIQAFRVPVPPHAEQAHIAAFLARETAKVDALVAEQQRLIELLKEKRQAVISHAVTKGLNPDVPMKDSGVDWLGEVPAHWRAVQVKHLARPGAKTFTDGDWIEAPYVTTEGVRLIQTGNVGVGFYKEQGFRYVSDATFEELGCTEVTPGDVLICRLDGPVGRACQAPDLGGRMITSVDNAILKVADDVAPKFIVALLSSVPWISWIDAICRVGGGFRLRVSRSQLGELRVPLPPLREQIEIARYLDVKTAGSDTLTAEAQRAIELLQERRSALISAAVTGQIDVRSSGKRASA